MQVLPRRFQYPLCCAQKSLIVDAFSLVVTPTTTIQVSATSSPSPLVSALGEVGNAGANPFGTGNGAFTMRQACTPVMVLAGAIAAALSVTF